MAEDKTSQDSKPSMQKQRPATTIDLPAEEVISSPSSAAGEPVTAESVSSEKSSETPNRARVAFTPLLGAAIGGGAVAIGALWYFGFILAGDVVTDISARLAKLEGQTRSATPAPDPGIINDIAARIAKLEAATASGPAAGSVPAPRVAILENNVKGIGDSVASLTGRHDELRAQLDAAQKSLAELRTNVAQQKGAEDSSELDKVASRIAPLESAVQNVQQAISSREANTADRAVRHALVASSLRDSVLRGAPYTTELAAFKSMGGDAAAVAVLEPFAAQGVPAPDKLCAELVKLLPKITAGSETPAKPAGFLDRLQVNAERLVRIRPIGEVAGADSKAVLARLESKTARADVDGALSELAQLPAAQRAIADAWIAKAKARQAAFAAAREISVKSVGALAP
jgi:hypothetical protein